MAIYHTEASFGARAGYHGAGRTGGAILCTGRSRGTPTPRGCPALLLIWLLRPTAVAIPCGSASTFFVWGEHERPLQRLAHSIAHVTHRAFIWPVDISFSRTLSLSLLNANPSAWFRGRMRYRTLLAMV
jgi:hypothetical protein